VSEKHWRDTFIKINRDFTDLLGDKAEIINVGSAINAGDSDTLFIATDKIHRNLLLLKKIKE
jgi:hypothetical protein